MKMLKIFNIKKGVSVYTFFYKIYINIKYKMLMYVKNYTIFVSHWRTKVVINKENHTI